MKEKIVKALIEKGDKALVVTADVCDARGLTEDTLAGYELVVLTADTLARDAKSRAILAHSPVVMTVDHVLDVEDGGELRVETVNGRKELYGGAGAEGPTLLTVNGTLTLGPGAKEALKNYAAITVNGVVQYPESLSGLLSGMTVNGRTEVYPDDCVVLRRTAELDGTFLLRAKENTRYFAARQVVALDPEVDFHALAAKKVGFVTGRALLPRSAAETAVPLFDERAELIVLPDGCAYVPEDAVLDRSLLERYGTKLYVDGDLTVDDAGAELLPRLEFLRLAGNAVVSAGAEDAFHKVRAKYRALVRPEDEKEQEDDWYETSENDDAKAELIRAGVHIVTADFYRL